MKCPKCGSEDTIGKMENGYCYCNHCKSRIDRYQQRLDKVLSKFEDDTQDYKVYFIKNMEISIYYNLRRKQFTMAEFRDFDIIISLETVESLLKDLEEKE